MRKVMLKLWEDDGGALIATEWVFVATILVIGVVVGLASVRNAVNAELIAFGDAVTGLQQCYSFAGLSSCDATVCGSAVTDTFQPPRVLTALPSVNTVINVVPCP